MKYVKGMAANQPPGAQLSKLSAPQAFRRLPWHRERQADLVSEPAANGATCSGVLICDPDMRIIGADAFARVLLGDVNPKDIAGHQVTSLLHPNDRQRAICRIEKMRAAPDRPSSDELRMRRSGNRFAWTRWSMSLLRASAGSGAAAQLRIAIQDIETPTTDELELVGREKLFCQALDEAEVGVLIGTTYGRPLLANQTMCELLGYQMSELMQLRYAEIAHAGDMELAREAFLRVLAREIKYFQDEKRYIRKDGGIVWITQGLSLVCDEATDKPLAFMLQAQAVDPPRRDKPARQQSHNGGTTYTAVSFVLTDRDGAIVQANAAFADMMGYARAELQKVSLIGFVDAGERADLLHDVQRLCGGESDGFRRQIRMRNKRGEIIWVLLIASIAKMPGGGPKILYQIVDIDISRDLTNRIKQLEELHEAKELAQITIASMAEGLIRTDIDGRITLCNEAAANLLGLPSEEIKGRHFGKLVSFIDHRNGRRLPDPVAEVLRQGKPIKLGPYAGLKRRDGRVRPIIDSTAPLRGLDGRMVGSVVVIQDATETFVLTERLAAQAYRDDLTRLPNRRAFEDHIGERLRAKHSPNRWDFLLFIDLDHFKVVNDTCGHASGDELLHEIAVMLRAQIRESDFLARLGGDEFGIVLHATSERKASAIAGGIVAALKDYRFIRNGRSFEIGASIGMTTIEACNGDASAVMIEADAACYAAKNLGRGRYHVFRRDDETIADAQRSMSWLHRIQRGFEGAGFKLFLQKIIDVAGITCGYEALLRLEEDGILCSPASFLPVAKRFGLIARIDRLIFEKVFELLCSGVVLGEALGPKYISVNMSAASLADPMFRQWLDGMLQRHPGVAGSLWIEITETDEMHWTAAEVEFLAKVRRMGGRLYLDDFGTGYNSFDVLKRITVDGIKIDRSVVREIASDPIDQALVIAAISIVADLGIDLVAEGVEDEATLNFLSHHGIKRFQGYLFHRPEPALPDAKAPAAMQQPRGERKSRLSIAGKLQLFN